MKVNNNGWVKIHRKFLEWEWYDKPEMVSLFLFCLMSANHEDGTWQGQEIKRGQFITGRYSLSSKIGISVQTIRTCLARLEQTGEITQKSTNRFSIITIAKYNDYQIDDSKLTNNQQTTNKQLTTNKKYKNDKKEKNNTNTSNAVALQGKQFGLLIKEFEILNPVSNIYGNITERKALEDMASMIGYDKLMATIKALPDIVCQPYAPKITKPTELKREFGKLLLFVKQKGNKTEKYQAKSINIK